MTPARLSSWGTGRLVPLPPGEKKQNIFAPLLKWSHCSRNVRPLFNKSRILQIQILCYRVDRSLRAGVGTGMENWQPHGEASPMRTISGSGDKITVALMFVLAKQWTASPEAELRMNCRASATQSPAVINPVAFVSAPPLPGPRWFVTLDVCFSSVCVVKYTDRFFVDLVNAPRCLSQLAAAF